MQTVSDRTLTAANSILLMRVKGFNDNFVQIEGYAADNAFDFGQGKIGETMMGVDGQQSGGYRPTDRTQSNYQQPRRPIMPRRSGFGRRR